MTKKQPNLLLRITCNNCFAITGENKEPYEPHQYSFGLWACCGSSPNTAITLNVLNADEVTHLSATKHATYGDSYSLVNRPNGLFYNGRLRDSALDRLTYETIYNTGRAELYVDRRRVGVVFLSWDDGRAYFCLEGRLVYLDEIYEQHGLMPLKFGGDF